MAGSQHHPPMAQRIARLLPTLTRAQRRMADYVLAHPLQAATQTIDELASALGVSVATANRFARALEFDGYPQFRAALVLGFESALALVDKVRQQVGRPVGDAGVFALTLSEIGANVERTRRALDPESCRQAVAAIGAAQRIAIAGYGSSGWLAGLLHRTLEPYCRQVHLLASLEGPGYGARVLSGLGPADLLIAIAFPRYSADTVFLARRAHQAGVPLLALTDKRSSPLAPLASVSLYAASESSYFVNSECSTLALIEALASAVAHHSRDPVQATGRLAAAAQPWLHGTAQSRLRPPPARDETPRPAARRRAAANAPSQPSVKPSRKATP